jgi:hypothetical protein
MTDAERPKPTSIRERLATTGLENLLASLTTKSLVPGYAGMINATGTTEEEEIHRRTVDVLVVTDPLGDIPFGSVVGEIRRKMRRMSKIELTKVYSFATGRISHSDPRFPLPARYQRTLVNLGRQAGRKIEITGAKPNVK